MSDSSVSAPPVNFVIWDLDGTILETGGDLDGGGGLSPCL